MLSLALVFSLLPTAAIAAEAEGEITIVEAAEADPEAASGSESDAGDSSGETTQEEEEADPQEEANPQEEEAEPQEEDADPQEEEEADAQEKEADPQEEKAADAGQTDEPEEDEGSVTVQAAAASDEDSSTLSATPSLTATEGTALTSAGGSLSSGSYYLEDDVKLKTNITIASGATVTIDLNGHTLTGTGSGSVIAVYGALTLTDGSTVGTGTVTGGSVTYGGGGGVYVHSSGAFEMSGGTISGNSVAKGNSGGGGVFVDGSGVFTMKGGTISGNSASNDGGGVYVNSSGTFEMSGGTIGGTGTDDANTAAYYGGGVYVNSSGTFEMSGGTISGNSVTESSFRGGGVYVDSSGIFTMKGGTISENEAGSGGGVFVYSGGKFTMDADTISGNTANSYGGGVYATGTFTMEGGTISGNKASTYGGGVYSGNTFTMEGGTISGNSASYGGGVYANGTFTMDDGTISGNTASNYGAGVYVHRSGTFEMSSGEISGNTASGSTNQRGGGVYSSGTFTMKGGTISGNKASTYGGGVYSDGTFTMEGGTISGNTASDSTGSHGGGVHVFGTFIMNGGTISGNTASGTTYGYGGGVCVESYGTFEMSGGTISGNKASGATDSQGGGVYVYVSAFTMNGGEISRNEATYGGGVHVDASSKFTMEGGTISGNKASSYGGGVYVYSNSKYEGTFIMSGGTISGNSASSYGGGVYVSGAFTVSGAPVVSGNTLDDDDGTANNVYLVSGKYITLASALTDGASIGVTTETTPTATKAVEITTAEDETAYYSASLNYFSSDNTDASVRANTSGKYLELYSVKLYKSDFTVNTDSVIYTGSEITKSVTSSLTAGTDYTVTYSDNKNAGTATIKIAGAGIYTGELTYTFTIEQKSVTASISGSTTKTYDGGDTVTDGGLSITLDGVVGSDVVTASASYAYDTADVGTDKTITATGINLGGTSAGNYALSNTTATANVGTITAKILTPSISGSTTKTYDGTRDVTAAQGLSIELDGVVDGDTVTASAGSYIYDTADVGEGKTITASGIALGGADAGNYSLESTSVTTTGTITQKGISKSDFTVDVATETYTGAKITKEISSTGNLVEDTDYTVTYSDNKNAGTATIIIAGTGNYSGALTYTFTIEQKSVTAAISGSATKTYDGTRNVTTAQGLSITLSGVVDGDTVTASASYAYDTADVGTDKTITASGINLGGTSAGNYTLSDTTATANVGTITAKPLTPSISGSTTKTYDGTRDVTAAQGLSIELDGVVDGDTVTASAGSYIYDTADVGEGKTITASGIDLTGDDAGNYTLSSDSATANVGTITQKGISKSDFTVDVEDETYTGAEITKEILSTGDLVEDTDYTVSYSDNKNAGTATITITGKGNYSGTLTYQFTIDKANQTLVLESESVTKTYGDADFVNGVTGAMTTLYCGSGNTEVATVGLNDGVVTIVGVGTTNIAIFAMGYPNYTDASAMYQLTVIPATPVVSLTGVESKTYDGTAVSDPTVSVTLVGEDMEYAQTITYYAVADDGTETELTGAPSAAGSYKVVVTVDAGSNYNTTSVEAFFDISKPEQEVKIEGFADVPYDGQAHEVTVTAASDATVTVTYTDADGNTVVAPVNAGTYTAHVTVTRDNYVTVEHDVVVSIALATQDVTIEGFTAADIAYDGQPHEVTVAADADATVTVTYTDADGNIVEAPVNAGTYTAHVTITKDNYVTVEQDVGVSIAQAAQAISYETTSVTKTEGDADFTNPLTQTTVDGEITYSSNDGSVATVDATGQVTIVGAGTATITATTAATGNYTEATASYTLTVEAAEEEEVIDGDDSDDDSGSSGKSSSSNTTTSPKTGDESKMVLWFTLMITAAFGLLATAVYSRKKNDEQ